MSSAAADAPIALPDIVISDLEVSLTHQLKQHGVAGTPHEAGARAAARNTLAGLWLHYQSERSDRVRVEREKRELEEKVARLEARLAGRRRPILAVAR